MMLLPRLRNRTRRHGDIALITLPDVTHAATHLQEVASAWTATGSRDPVVASRLHGPAAAAAEAAIAAARAAGGAPRRRQCMAGVAFVTAVRALIAAVRQAAAGLTAESDPVAMMGRGGGHAMAAARGVAALPPSVPSVRPSRPGMIEEEEEEQEVVVQA